MIAQPFLASPLVRNPRNWNGNYDSPLLSYRVEEIQTHALLCAGKMKLLSLMVQGREVEKKRWRKERGVESIWKGNALVLRIERKGEGRVVTG